jgi:hypothetical protein
MMFQERARKHARRIAKKWNGNHLLLEKLP